MRLLLGENFQFLEHLADDETVVECQVGKFVYLIPCSIMTGKAAVGAIVDAHQ